MAPPIPDRWLDYKPIGDRIEGTRFIAFKVPLREHIMKSVDKELRLDDKILLELIPNLGMIIDLTNTNRYYDPIVFLKNGVEYNKLMIPGHITPPQNLVNTFKQMVKRFIKKNPDNDKLIGVHCTHGVNRTGFLICNYMISEMAIEPDESIKKFDNARGHKIERINYLEALSTLPENHNQNDEGNDDAVNNETAERIYQPNTRYVNRNNYNNHRSQNWRSRERNNEHTPAIIENWRSPENNIDRPHIKPDYYGTRKRVSHYQQPRPSRFAPYPSPQQNTSERSTYNDRSRYRSDERNDHSRSRENNSYQPRLKTNYYGVRPSPHHSRPRIEHLQRQHPDDKPTPSSQAL